MMTTMKKTVLATLVGWILALPLVYGQKIDDVRMSRDIEVAENILSTLIKQQLEQDRAFFTVDIRGSYQPGYGVTFHLPADYTAPLALMMMRGGGQDATTLYGDPGQQVYSVGSAGNVRQQGATQDARNVKGYSSLTDKSQQKARDRFQADVDSVSNVFDVKIINASKNFIIDYGDLISQLAPNERIVVTNKGDQARNPMVDQYLNQQHKVMTIEGVKSSVVAFKQGKLTRDQALKTLSVVNTVPVEKAEPDVELLSTIFARLYQPDLSKTYFGEEYVYYEHLKDFGVVYYMQVFSAMRIDPMNPDRIAMPTLGLMDVDPELRDRKAKEMYPQFEQELKVNMLEYGRTLKSLGNDESLIVNVGLTKCAGCGIPATLELSIKASVLKDFAAGKLDQSTALDKFQIKKGTPQ